MLTCEYCGKNNFRYQSELTLHIAHTHPQALKERGIEGFFQVLQDREKSGYYVKQISYWKKRR